MKRISILLCLAILAGLATAGAQEIDKAEMAEKMTRLATDLEAVQTSNATIQKRFSTLGEELRSAREEISRLQAAHNNSTTSDELKRLAEKIIEVDKKREADKKLILDEMKGLKETILSSIKELGAAPARASNPATPRASVSTNKDPSTNSSTPAKSDKFYEHTVEKGESLPTIVSGYNEEFKKQNKKTITRKSVMDANPNVKWDRLLPRQKILIPVPE